MFIFDFVAETILDQILDWIYGKIIGFLNDFFVMMNNMGVELFELPWVNAVTTFFSYLGWALFGVGLVVGAFECAIEYQGGRGSIKDTAMNYIKGFMAVSLFTVVPVNLYSLCVSLQGTFGSAITGITNAESIGLTAQQVLMSASFPGIGNPILMTFCAVMMGYAVIKVFFANLKRGGILLIQIAVGSLYMFSVPRGYIDGFIQWCKQVIDMYPLYWTPSRGGIIMRYTYEYKRKCVELYREGKWPETPEGVSDKSFRDKVRLWVRAEDSRGPEALKHKNFNRNWTPEERLELVSQVMSGKSCVSVAIEAGIQDRLLYQWVQNYKTKGYNGLVEMKKGRPSKGVPQMKKEEARPLNESEREELIRLRAENEYIKAENEVIKKEIALREERHAAQLKARKQRSSKSCVKKDTN